MKIVVSMLLVLVVASSFTMEEEKIAWSAERKLTWDDFKGTPNAAEEYVASTNSGMSFSFSIKEINGVPEIDYTVISNFYPDLSWYRPERVNRYILEHEQTHFDISELHARKLRKSLAALSDDSNFRQLAETIYNQMETARRNMQIQYDTETDHSNIEEAEYRWRQYVQDQLKVLDAWK